MAKTSISAGLVTTFPNFIYLFIYLYIYYFLGGGGGRREREREKHIILVFMISSYPPESADIKLVRYSSATRPVSSITFSKRSGYARLVLNQLQQIYTDMILM